MKELNGKALELFEEFIKEKSYDLYLHLGAWDGGYVDSSCFGSDSTLIPFPFQWGVWQDFAATLGYNIDAYSTENYGYEFYIGYIKSRELIDVGEDYEYIDEARLACIRSLNEILNEKQC